MLKREGQGHAMMAGVWSAADDYRAYEGRIQSKISILLVAWGDLLPWKSVTSILEIKVTLCLLCLTV